MISSDKEHLSDSMISWQSLNLADSLDERDKQKINEANTENIVNFLTGLLMQEIKDDLFPRR